jgi:hypothetical protein
VPKRTYVPSVLMLEDGYLVKHTHDVDKAKWMVQKAVAKKCWGDDFRTKLTRKQVTEIPVGPGKAIHCRIAPCLPHSDGARAGWAWQYFVTDGPGRGVIQAVEFEL